MMSNLLLAAYTCMDTGSEWPNSLPIAEVNTSMGHYENARRMMPKFTFPYEIERAR